MLKSFILLWVSLAAESSSCQCLSVQPWNSWAGVSRAGSQGEHWCLCGILHGLLAGKHQPAEHSSASLPTVPALTYLVPQQSWEWGYKEYAFHNSLFLWRAAFWLCTPCLTLSCGSLFIYCADGVGLGNGTEGVRCGGRQQNSETSPAVFREVYPIKGFINLAGQGMPWHPSPGAQWWLYNGILGQVRGTACPALPFYPQ